MDDKRSKVFTAHQGKFGSQWLNGVPCKNLGLKLDDQELRISIGLRRVAVNSSNFFGRKDRGRTF